MPCVSYVFYQSFSIFYPIKSVKLQGFEESPIAFFIGFMVFRLFSCFAEVAILYWFRKRKFLLFDKQGAWSWKGAIIGGAIGATFGLATSENFANLLRHGKFLTDSKLLEPYIKELGSSGLEVLVSGNGQSTDLVKHSQKIKYRIRRYSKTPRARVGGKKAWLTHDIVRELGYEGVHSTAFKYDAWHQILCLNYL